MESKIPQPQMEPKVPSPTLSAASKGEQATAPQKEEMPMVKEPADQRWTASAPQKSLEKGRMGKIPDVSEATHDSMSVREPASQGSAPLADEEVQQRPVSGEAGNAFLAMFFSFSDISSFTSFVLLRLFNSCNTPFLDYLSYFFRGRSILVKQWT